MPFREIFSRIDAVFYTFGLIVFGYLKVNPN